MEKNTRFPSPKLKASVLWNARKMVGAKRALKEKHVWAIRFWLGREQRVRDKALFDLALDSKLRGCDLVSFRIGDIVTSGLVLHRAMVVQQKTRWPVEFEITETTRLCCIIWCDGIHGVHPD